VKRLVAQYLDASAVRVLEGGIPETQAMLREKSAPARLGRQFQFKTFLAM